MLITDPDAPADGLVGTVAAAIRGGVTAVQLRGPGWPARVLLATARALTVVVREGGALLLVNDRVDVALAAGADGVHLKRNSIDLADARRLVGPDRLIGASTHSEAEVREAFQSGADYVVFGPVLATPSKAGIFEPRGAARFGEVARAAAGPVLALGGVSEETLPFLALGDLPGIAVIRAVFAASDPEAAARRLARMLAGAGDPA